VPRRRVHVHGTVLGLPTFAELADLVAVQRFNLAQLDLAKPCPGWAAKDPLGYGQWAGLVYDATATMIKALDFADQQLALIPEALRAVTPVAAGSLFAPNAWDQILSAAAPFRALIATYAAQSGCPWPAGSPPQPTAPDFDLKVYQWTGKALQSIEFGGAGILLLVAAFFLFGGKR
jgi:hypothetical protein